mmetsp:Transcript_69451/g.144841  ORF Transcript_69451/g.144841 Transcript_69451/m.144841 type:complete len:107 (-) Transcript_69451:12-332(-)
MLRLIDGPAGSCDRNFGSANLTGFLSLMLQSQTVGIAFPTTASLETWSVTYIPLDATSLASCLGNIPWSETTRHIQIGDWKGCFWDGIKELSRSLFHHQSHNRVFP